MISYRTKQLLRNLFITLLVLILLAVVFLACWLLWLNRYVIYTPDGAKLDFNLNVEFSPGVSPEEPGPAPSVNIHFNEEDQTQKYPKELVRFSGYTVTAQELKEDFDTVYDQLMALPEGSTIALQVKDLKGFFYYSSTLGRQSGDVSIPKMEDLITQLKAKGHYLIARFPAFQDYYYFLDDEAGRVPYGLALDGGNGSLWLDRSFGCYWFNPASDGTLSYLIQIVMELRQKGFQEVLLEDFRFPKTSMIKFDPDDEPEALANAAATIVNSCGSDSFAISFGRKDTALTMPEGRCRLFITDAVAADIATLAHQVTLPNPAVQLGFLTDLHDTRFDQYCVLRPLSAAQE